MIVGKPSWAAAVERRLREITNDGRVDIYVKRIDKHSLQVVGKVDGEEIIEWPPVEILPGNELKIEGASVRLEWTLL